MRKLKIIAFGLATLGSVAGGAFSAFAYSEAQFRSVTNEQEAQLEQLRDQEINQIKIVLGRRFSETRRPDILLRLAELYVEKYRFYSFKENEIHRQRFQQGLKPRNVDTSRSRRYLKQATNSCLAILKSRVPFSKMDEVYYFLGYNAEELGHRKEAQKYFEKVAARYSSSTYAPEAYRNLAEYAFEQKKFAKSVQLYEQAAKYTGVASFPRTLYKLAWAYFKTRRRGEALSTMKKVVDLSRSQEKFVGLRDEALNDLVMFFSEAGKWKDAHDYFERVGGGPELYIKALNKLSQSYERRGDHKLAKSVNNTLIEEYGERRPDLVFEVLGRNVEIEKRQNDVVGEEAALGRLVKFLSDHRGEVSKNEDNEVTVQRTKSYLRRRATEIHKDAQKKKNEKLYAKAAGLYGLYITAFLAKPENEKQAKELTEIRAYRSDALLAAGRERDAMVELQAALENDGDSKRRREAGATLLNLLIKKIDAKKGNDATVEAQFLSVAETFEKNFPNDKLVGELRYKKARLAATKSGPEGLNSDAKSALKELIEKYPSRPESIDAARDLVGDAVKRKDLDEAARLAKAFHANYSLMAQDRKHAFSKYLDSVVSHHAFGNVQSLEKDRDYLNAAAEYEKLAASSPGDKEVAFKAYNNAAVNFEKGGDLPQATRVYTAMTDKFPSNPGPREELKRIAASLLWNGQYQDSAKLYGKLAQLPGFSNDEKLSLGRTAFFLDWGSGDSAAAFLAGLQVLQGRCEKNAYQDERCHEIALEVGRLLIESGRLQEGLNHLRHYAGLKGADVRKAEANYLVGTIYQQLHDERKAALHFEDASRAVANHASAKKTTGERNAAAHAAFLLVEPEFAHFNGLRLTLPEDNLKSVTKKKLSALEGLVTRYLNVVKYGDGEWGIAALERLHDAFAGFAVELENAPVPPRLSDPAKKDQYLHGLKQVAEPMMARALEYLRQGHQKGIQLGVTSPTFIALTQRLSRRLPREFPPAHLSIANGEDSEDSRHSKLRLMGPLRDESPADLARPGQAWRREIAAKLVQNAKSHEAWIELGNLESLAGRYKLARLLYEQALALRPKDPAALSNLSVVLLLEQKPIEATQGFLKALDLAEASKDLRFNLAKVLLSFHHFKPAVEHLRGLSARYPQDAEIAQASAVAYLGAGDLNQAGTRLKALDAEGGKGFDLWYNWDVWALVTGSHGQREDAMDRLKKRRSDVGALEKSQIDVSLDIGAALAKAERGGR